MEINSSSIPLTGYTALEKTAAGHASRQVSPPVEPEQPTLAIRALADAKQAEFLLIRNRQRQQYQDLGIDMRSRRAIDAYATQDQVRQKDYLSALLGIDEYV